MRKYTKRIAVSAAMVIIFIVATILILNHHYNQAIESMLPPRIEYHDVVIERSLNADYFALFSAAKREIYFGKTDDSDKIEIIIPGKVTITVYPHDENSVIIDYAPHQGIRRKYKLSRYGDFSKHLETLYRLTENEIFLEK